MLKAGTLDTYRGSLGDRAALVIGSGPSVIGIDDKEEILKEKYTTIVVNGGILHMRKPSFFFTADVGCMQFRYFEKVRQGSFPVAMCSVDVGSTEAFNGIGVGPDRMVFYERESKSFMDPSADKLVFGTNSAHAAVHFAVTLGCPRVYLIGCDCRYKDGNKYGWEITGDNRGRHWTGRRSMHIGWQSVQGKPVGEREYAPGADGEKDGQLGADIGMWQKIVDANPQLDLVDVSDGSLGSFMKTATLEELLS